MFISAFMRVEKGIFIHWAAGTVVATANLQLHPMDMRGNRENCSKQSLIRNLIPDLHRTMSISNHRPRNRKLATVSGSSDGHHRPNNAHIHATETLLKTTTVFSNHPACVAIFCSDSEDLRCLFLWHCTSESVCQSQI